ncbi:nuclear transport factor 2-like protein [Hymenobacter properus]|uniref:Nuclear transport factor 2 family protein n=1 Tax=Hymenobacter properus TaxID=2791026 RepID=A0A931BKH2_9BACT|nr:nuclear transport factor 2 family protein [Hymenobacter properus]MBF9143903.1 nuclear transport factor 2 family protein [Hymenobacter properus]MBR7722717.1 nuclear transport factor 2 family protein [Microvirga sp. SRT04]
MNAAQLLEDSLLVIWNDRDANRRLAAMSSVYASDIAFFEGHGAEPITGHQAINELITKLQAEWPVEFQFKLTKPAQANKAVQLITWQLGADGALPVATGADVAIVENGLIKGLYLFLDRAEKA